MATRRSFIAGMLATGAMPKPTWADAGEPAYLSAGMTHSGAYVLCGLGADGQITFELPLPARGHAAAAHPSLPVAVAFARRPGTYAVVLDCIAGRAVAGLEAPPGHHFYGHGTFSADGEVLFTTENDFDAARGVIGIWDARNQFVRIGEFASGGIGPHDIKLVPDGKTLVIANGGIETHPETGRTKLNIPSMRPNLSYISLEGRIEELVELGVEHMRNSIRHLAVSANGTVAFAMQWQGDRSSEIPLLGTHDRIANTFQFAEAASVRRMQGYLGSVAVSEDGKSVATTSPRAGLLQEFQQLDLVTEANLVDVCGVAPSDTGFFVTTGTGMTISPSGGTNAHPVAWDNHLVTL